MASPPSERPIPKVPEHTDNFERDTLWGVRMLHNQLATADMPAKLTTYAAMTSQRFISGIDGVRLKDYVLVDIEFVSREESIAWFSQDLQPVPGLTPSEQNQTSERAFRWPTILRELDIHHQVTTGNYIGTVVQRDEEPAWIDAHDIIWRYWWTVVPWPSWAVKTNPPKPDIVNWNFPLATDNETGLVCLHGNIDIPGFQATTGRYQGLTVRGKAYSETNPPTWQAFIAIDEQQEGQGRWLRRQAEYFPPFIPARRPRSPQPR